ncbi:transcriptional regulator [Legionella lansingensis]|uniref:Transcriptional regulator n=1 Tax=Legionella lansingensis TaxID=45067 RepID=A0A0W0VRP8_9GAMM|nr:hypothetical protein [Legionella lansingensis]KTD22814.1 transcriptional regulator [Legionella lansingensis]SNV49721.1 transcriptional regulator [Legionella lansingensis]
MKLRLLGLAICTLLLVSCASRPPRDVNNICSVFHQYPKWYRAAADVERRWKVPVAVQMAIIHQESKFNGRAKPPRRKLLWVIPWKRPSTAYGYTQALRSTWAVYKNASNGGSMWASRGAFSDAVDFVGWYANEANKRAGIPRNDAYQLYLAYHEGIGGYQRRTYLRKPWLIQVARKVKTRSQIFQAQLNQCRGSLPRRSWLRH